MYKRQDKLIDPEMFVRNDCKEPLLAGKVGIFFNAWWGGYTVADATPVSYTHLDVYKRQI